MILNYLYNLILKLSIALLLMVQPGAIFSQQENSTSKHFLSMQLARGKTGYFHNISYHTTLFSSIHIESSLGVNIQKMYAQNRWAPQVDLGVGYDVLSQKPNIKLIPKFKTRYAHVRLFSDLRFHFTEYLLGYTLLYGEQFFIGQGASFGRGREFAIDFKTTTPYWTYNIFISAGYRF